MIKLKSDIDIISDAVMVKIKLYFFLDFLLFNK